MMMDLMRITRELQDEFRFLGIPEPVAIVMSSFEDGMKLLSAAIAGGRLVYDPARGVPNASIVEGENGAVYAMMKVGDLEIRWPAKRFALPSGGWRWG